MMVGCALPRVRFFLHHAPSVGPDFSGGHESWIDQACLPGEERAWRAGGPSKRAGGAVWMEAACTPMQPLSCFSPVMLRIARTPPTPPTQMHQRTCRSQNSQCVSLLRKMGEEMRGGREGRGVRRRGSCRLGGDERGEHRWLCLSLFPPYAHACRPRGRHQAGAGTNSLRARAQGVAKEWAGARRGRTKGAQRPSPLGRQLGAARGAAPSSGCPAFGAPPPRRPPLTRPPHPYRA